MRGERETARRVDASAGLRDGGAVGERGRAGRGGGEVDGATRDGPAEDQAVVGAGVVLEPSVGPAAAVVSASVTRSRSAMPSGVPLLLQPLLSRRAKLSRLSGAGPREPAACRGSIVGHRRRAVQRADPGERRAALEAVADGVGDAERVGVVGGGPGEVDPEGVAERAIGVQRRALALRQRARRPLLSLVKVLPAVDGPADDQLLAGCAGRGAGPGGVEPVAREGERWPARAGVDGGVRRRGAREQAQDELRRRRRAG